MVNAYLDRKQVQGFATKLRGLDLLVPMRDVDGKMWGIQTITPEGKKYFMAGQKVEGCFHTIGGEIENEIYICEGYATAATIHMATGKVVVCAFNAGNLQSVSIAVRKKYPLCSIIICADDDQFTDGNPGITKATAAAKSALAVVVSPKFKNLAARPTDFNDLHVTEGLDEVKRQLVVVKPEKTFIIPLGYNFNDYYFISNANPQIQTISGAAMTKQGLLRIQPLEYWEAISPGPRGVRWDKVASDLMAQCHAKGIFTPERIRGRGVWMDHNKVVVHLGDRLYYENSEQPLHRNSLKSKFIYEQAPAMRSVDTRPLNVTECEKLLEPLALLKFARPHDYILLAGWLALAPICGALPWRPHVWLTGPTGSGKSYVMQYIIRQMLAEYSEYFLGQTSEAGIRQAAGTAARPVIFDEFETNDEKSDIRIKSILELARQSSSESDAVVAKGSTTGEAIFFKPRFSMLVSSVRINLPHEEDKNRFTVLELQAHDEKNNEQFKQLEKLIAELSPVYASRLFSRVVSKIDVVLASIKVCQKVLREKVSARFGQQYAPLLAGYYVTQSDAVMTEDIAASLLSLIHVEVEAKLSETGDELQCLHLITEKKERIGQEDRLIGELIQEVHLQQETGLAANSLILQRNGLFVDDGFLFVANRFDALSKIYSRSKWTSNYAKTLQRIAGSKPVLKWFPMLRRGIKCTALPIKVLS